MPTLTARVVARQKPRVRPFEVSCATLRGFMVRVLPSGKKVYYARVPSGGKYRRVRIGLVGILEFSEARESAARLLLEGKFPERKHAPRRRARPATSEVPTLCEFAARYDAGHIAIHLKPATQKRYRQQLRCHLLPTFGQARIDEIELEDVERFHASLSDRPNAANNAVRILSNMYTKAIAWRLLPRGYLPPTRGVRLNRENRRERFLTPQERAKIERVLEEGLRRGANQRGGIHWSIVAVIRLLSMTGMRRSEVLGLTWDMVDRRHRCFRLPDSKTGQKVVPVSDQVFEYLDSLEIRRLPGVPFVAYSRVHSAVSKKGVGDAWIRVRKAAGLGDTRLHDLRHSAASDALMAGVPLAVVGKILGHRDPKTTARYAHLSDQVVRSGVDAMGAAIAGKRTQR